MQKKTKNQANEEGDKSTKKSWWERKPKIVQTDTIGGKKTRRKEKDKMKTKEKR